MYTIQDEHVVIVLYHTRIYIIRVWYISYAYDAYETTGVYS